MGLIVLLLSGWAVELGGNGLRGDCKVLRKKGIRKGKGTSGEAYIFIASSCSFFGITSSI